VVFLGSGDEGFTLPPPPSPVTPTPTPTTIPSPSSIEPETDPRLAEIDFPEPSQYEEFIVKFESASKG
jgi:hypothetical protein